MSLGVKNMNDALALSNNDRGVEDIMPAQQSNMSAEDLDDEEGRTKEIPRQSVLSNLVESSISNFENESGDEVEEARLDQAVDEKNKIKIEKQASISYGKPHNNLRSRKSQKANKRKREPVVVTKSNVDEQ